MKEEYRQAQLRAKAAIKAESQEAQRRDRERVQKLSRVIADGQAKLIDEMVDAIYLHNYLGNAYAAMDECDLRKQLERNFKDDDEYLEARGRFVAWKNQRASEINANAAAVEAAEVNPRSRIARLVGGMALAILALIAVGKLVTWIF